MSMSYLSVEIYRPDGYDCTRNGVTSVARATGKIFVVPCKDGNWTEEEVANRDRFIVLDIERRNIGGEYVNLRPREAGKSWTMFGGNFAWTSDSRFRAVFSSPLAVHDRIEG